jgi:hypothetical protein
LIAVVDLGRRGVAAINRRTTNPNHHTAPS